jgi:glycolate oxidase iron-sulfur subunit
VDAIITSCGSCGLAIKHEWKNLLGLDVPDDLASKVYDITEFLVDCLGITEVGIPQSAIRDPKSEITYHDPCHLARGMGVRKQPRQLLASVPGIELVEMVEADRCCGAGGTFSIYHPDLSRRIGGRKAANVTATGTDLVATGCLSCAMQLSEMLARAGSSQKVTHTACVLWNAVRNG